VASTKRKELEFSPAKPANRAQRNIERRIAFQVAMTIAGNRVQLQIATKMTIDRAL
jgi:hypothetical protein